MPAPFTRPNIFVSSEPFSHVTIAGMRVLAVAVKFSGFKLEGTWKKQKSKSTDGAVFSWGGMDPVGGEAGWSVTFRITSIPEFDQLYDLFDALKPAPVAGAAPVATASGANGKSAIAGSAPAKAPGSPPASAEKILADAQAALAKLNSPTPAPGSQAAADASGATPAAAQPSPGPRPPTVGVELGWLSFLGVFAGALKSWDFSTLEPDKIEVTIGFVTDKPPTPAASGAMAPPASPGAQYGSTGGQGPPPGATAPSKGAAQGAAGT